MSVRQIFQAIYRVYRSKSGLGSRARSTGIPALAINGIFLVTRRCTLAQSLIDYGRFVRVGQNQRKGFPSSTNFWKSVFWISCLAQLMGCGSPGTSKASIALILGGSPATEEAAWLSFADAHLAKPFDTLHWSDLAAAQTDLSGYELLWIHQTAPDLPEASAAAKQNLRSWLESGGRMLLDMEAVHLLNRWGLEPEPLQTQTDTIVDEGFGRPLGFHAFKDHVLFDGLHGGAYPWKSPVDHTVRKTGFFGESQPANPQARVIATEWTYITFHPDAKLVLEYPTGAGKILAIGAFTYFEPDNDNHHELVRLYQNATDYLLDQITGPVHYWTYDTPTVTASQLPAPEQALPTARRWQEPDWSISAKKEAPDDAFVNLAGRRMLVMGKERGGIDEVWTHPFMAARDLHTGIVRNGKITWLDDLPARLTVSPEALLRKYTLAGQTIREYTTVSFDQPLALLHYEFPTETDVAGIVFQATFNARYMWPYDAEATGSIQYDFDESSRTLRVAAQDTALCTLLGFSQAPQQMTLGRYRGFDRNANLQVNPQSTDRIQLATRFFIPLDQGHPQLDIALAGSAAGLRDLLLTYQQQQLRIDQLHRRTHEHYRSLQDRRLQITSPDSIFNTGYRWALARTDQFFQTTPGIGTTHMAGFGTTARGWNGRHKVSGRPGYAWYFGRDGEWSGMAVNAYGDFAWVREMLKVFQSYQALNGKIFHELTTSGAVHYDAADATPLYVVLAAHYLKYSNDQDFLNELWPSLEKALAFCASTDTDGDGLIENTNVGHGWIEGGALFNVHTEFYLAGSWAACLDAASYIAGVLGKKEAQREYQAQADQVKTIIDEKFWDAPGQYFYNALYADGRPQKEAAVLQAVPVYLGAIPDTGKARAALSPFAGRGMTTDWGIRMIADDNPLFNPRSYHAGMVWPLYGGWAALGEYVVGHYNSAFFHTYANLINYRYWSAGSVEETLHGAYFRPAGVCSQQCWSETMVLLPIIEGMLGIRPDAPRRTLTLQPRFPVHWPFAEVTNIRMGQAVIDLLWSRSPGQTSLSLQERGSTDTAITLHLQPALPLGSQIEQVQVNGQDHPYRTVKGPESVEVILDPVSLAANGTLEVALTHTGGIGLAPLTIFPEREQPSQGARILSQHINEDTWTARFDGLPGRTYEAILWSEVPITKITGGRISDREGAQYTLTFSGPAEVRVQRTVENR